MKRLRPLLVALAGCAAAGVGPTPGVAGTAHDPAAASVTPDARRADERDARTRKDGGGARMAATAPGVLAGPGEELPRATYGRDIPLPRATYKYADAVKADLVVVFKGQRVLHLMKHGEVVGSYQIALGFAPEGHKLRSGDGRTPEGVYTIDWRNPNSRFHRSLHISYPAPRDRERAGRLGVHPGHDIMIHGLPADRSAAALGHPYLDWTEGCIAVTSDEMDDIWERVDDGTTIIIYP